MESVLAKRSWALLLRGIIAIFFGVTLLAFPAVVTRVLITVFGGYALIAGIFTIMTALGSRSGERHSSWMIVEGVVGIIAGIIAFAAPLFTLFTLVVLLGAWAIGIGIMEVLAAVTQYRDGSVRLLLILSGLLSVLFGVLVMQSPIVGGLVIASFVGIYTIFFGLLVFSLGMIMRNAAMSAQS